MKNNVALDKLIVWKIRLAFLGTSNSGVLGPIASQPTKDAWPPGSRPLTPQNRQIPRTLRKFRWKKKTHRASRLFVLYAKQKNNLTWPYWFWTAICSPNKTMALFNHRGKLSAHRQKIRTEQRPWILPSCLHSCLWKQVFVHKANSNHYRNDVAIPLNSLMLFCLIHLGIFSSKEPHSSAFSIKMLSELLVLHGPLLPGQSNHVIYFNYLKIRDMRW